MIVSANESSPVRPGAQDPMAALLDEHNAAQLFFTQAARPELADAARFMVRGQTGWSKVTWRQAARRVERLAATLITLGVDEGVKVAVLAQTRLEWATSGLAALAARGTLVPVYPTLVGETLAHVLGHSDARVLVVESHAVVDRIAPLLPTTSIETLVLIEGPASELDGVRVIALDEAEEAGAAALQGDPTLVMRRLQAIRKSDLAYLIYTSGTTGLPKGVQLTHGNVGASGRDWIALNGSALAEGDVDLLWLPMSHVFGWGELCLGNELGLVSYLSDPQRVLDDLPTVRPHVFMSVPAYWEKLAGLALATATPEQTLTCLTGGRLRFCLSGGAGLSRQVKETFLRAGVLIIEGYGLTECSPTLTLNRRDAFDFDSVGQCLPTVELRLADDGEILARGPNVFSGYYKDPAATAAAFTADGWFCTGDLGRFDERGFLRLVGRKKEILVTAGGKNVPPVNIEQHFAADPLIARVMVYGDGRPYLTALVDIDDAEAERRLLAEGLAASLAARPREQHRVRGWIEERIAEVNTRLARFETIKRFCLAPERLTVEAGLLTASLKLRRAAIGERYQALFEALYTR